MSTIGESRKSEQLGMPFGTAANRLRKLVLFHVLKKHKENICYRCEREITLPEELSIEHKKPWLNTDPELFWDMDNIAFSHLSCNIKSVRPEAIANRREFMHVLGVQRRKVGVVGYAWCCVHQDFLPIENFTKSHRRANGLEWLCRECRRKRRKRC
jgi:hypothetical protein